MLEVEGGAREGDAIRDRRRSEPGAKARKGETHIRRRRRTSRRERIEQAGIKMGSRFWKGDGRD